MSHIQGGSVNVWKENVIEDLEEEAVEYESVGKFLTAIKKEFGGGKEELVKVAELKKLEQEGRIMEEFVQEFRRAARGSGYKECSLIEEFKRGINATIRKRLIEVENQPGLVEQWFRRATALGCNLNNEDMLREVMVKIGLERINMQEEITVEALLNSGVTGLVMSLEFAKKQGFKLKKLEKPMYVRNVDSLLNKEEPIEYMVEVNIYYQGHRERMEIDVIGGQK